MSILNRLRSTPKHRLAGWALLGYGAVVLVGAVIGAEITLRSRARWVPGQFVPVLRRRNVVLLPVSGETVSRGVVGIVPVLPNKGHALLGPHKLAGTLVRRSIQDERGVLPNNSLAWVSTYVYNGTPEQLGIGFEDTTVHTDVGDMPAWHVPSTSGERDAIAIVIHGHGGQRAQGLRMLPALRRSGVASLFVTFRNAFGAPKVGQGYQTLGDQEAADVVAALRWAKDAGYKRAVLYGFSMGGNIALSALRPQYEPHPIPVTGVVLDGPALDWRNVIQANARRRGLPPFMARHIATFVQFLVRRRSGQDFDAVDQLAAAPTFKVPIVLFHGDRDGTIPVSQSDKLAEARPDLVEYHRVEGAKHIRCWNIDPVRYDLALEAFVARVVPEPEAEPA